jgi:type I restriction enzyme S subunit
MLQSNKKSEWAESPLGEKAYEVRELYEPRKDDDFKYIGLEHIEQQSLRLSGFGNSSDTVSTKKVFKRGDILFGTLRPYFRKVVMPKYDGVCSTDITVIRAKQNTEQVFLWYLIATHEFINYASNISSGTRMPRANWKVLEKSKWLFPSFPVQHKIASILSAYDDLIENNNRRIKILEEMAQAIYREWFVNFRFPGHEKVKMVKSKLGMIPEGWEIKKLSELTAVITKGITPTTLGKSFQEEGINFLKVESIDENGHVIVDKLAKIDEETHELLKRSQLQENDIIFSIAGAIGRTTVVPLRILPANTNQALAIIRPSDRFLANYLFLNISAKDFIKFSLARVVQTAQANVSLGVLSSAPILLPFHLILKKFDELIFPYRELGENLQVKNLNLRKTRDLLLPKLISGEVDVEKLDIQGMEA